MPAERAYLIAFDLLEFDRSDLRLLPLHERRERLVNLIANAPDALRFSDHVDGHQGEALLRHACALNLEGIISKRAKSPYRSGRYDGWRKIRCAGYERSSLGE